MILSVWIRQTKLTSVPMDILQIIINLYLYQPRFDECKRMICNDKKTNKLPYDFLLKFLLIGNNGVGKTSFLYTWNTGQFNMRCSKDDLNRPDLTIQDIHYKQKMIRIQLWNTPKAMSRYRSIKSAYYRGAHVVIICYDITDKQSLHDTLEWGKECDTYAVKCTSKWLVGLKSDLKSERACDKRDVRKIANKLGVEHFEVSSKDGINVNNVIEEMAKHIVDFPFYG